MKKVIVIWKKQSSKNNCFYVGVKFETEMGFITSKCLEATQTLFDSLELQQEIEVPVSLLD